MISLIFGSVRAVISALAACACCIFITRWYQKSCKCCERFDIRKLPGVAPLFLKLGIDEFAEFSIIVVVHSVQDVKLSRGLKVSSPDLHVKAEAKYERATTRSSKAGKWEQTLKLTIPQGSSEVFIGVYEGKNRLIGKCDINISKLAGQNADRDTFKKGKRWMKLTLDDENSSGDYLGKVGITFKRVTTDIEEGEGLLGDNTLTEPLEGLDPEEKPALYAEVVELMNEYPRSTWPLSGKKKLEILSKILCGRVEQISTKRLGLKKNAENQYHAVVFGFLPNDSDSDSEIEKKNDRAAKWLWMWWESHKAYMKGERCLGAVSILSITSLHIDHSKESPELFFRYADREEEGKKSEIRFRSKDKDIEIWLDALELLRDECRKEKEAKKRKEQEFRALPAEERFNVWIQHYEKQGYTREELMKYYRNEMLSQMSPEQQRQYFKEEALQKQKEEESPRKAGTSTSHSLA